MIAVIDDSIASRVLVRHAARKAKDILSIYSIDNDVEMFGSPDDFIQWLADTNSKPDIILLDFDFRGSIISTELIEKIIFDKKLNSSLIIGWSGDIDAIDVFHQAGIHGFISKNYTGDLFDTIVTALTIYKNGWFEFL